MSNKKLLDRDISWLSFNKRVFDEADKNSHTLGEKVMFIGITGSNLDEFLKVRYPATVLEDNTDRTEDLVKEISKHYRQMISRWVKFNKKYELIRPIKTLSDKEKNWLDKYFKQNVYPTLLPVTVDKARRANIQSGLYIMTATEKNGNTQVGYIEVPSVLGRFIQIPGKNYVVKIEDLIIRNISSIIHGRKIMDVIPFAISRSAEVYNTSDVSADPFELIKETLHERLKSWITCIEIQTDDKKMIKLIQKILPISDDTLVLATSFVRLYDLKTMPSSVYKDKDKSRKLTPVVTFPKKKVFEYIAKKDRLCFHPYESYDGSFVNFIETAAKDPDVVSIRITLYRVSDNSKIVKSLLTAATKGKQVTVLVELKARFDEQHNMEVATILREAGVRIVYTKPDIKTHAKVCLVTRKEKKGLVIYSHVGTGNYSESNSKLYTDYSYFTANHQIGTDLTKFFNLLTSDQDDFKSKKIIYAPYNLRSEIVDQINEQIKRAKNKKDAAIIIKCNSLTDDGIAKKLIEAADEGVKIWLIVRSACIIQPQKNIRICSIVGDQLEHSRVYVFGVKNPVVMIGSADLMYRNMNKRNELLLVVEPESLKNRILQHLDVYMKDNVNRRIIDDNYEYHDVKVKSGTKRFSCHKWFAKEAKELALD